MSNTNEKANLVEGEKRATLMDYTDFQKKTIRTNPVPEAKSERDPTITEECLDTSKKNKELKELFDRLWKAADELRANSALRSTQYSTPVLGLIFLRYADFKFEEATRLLQKELGNHGRPIRKLDYQARGVVYLAESARYKQLLSLPEEAGIGKAIDDAMKSIEAENEELRDVLPKVYINIGDKVLVNLLKLFHVVPTELDQDIFGKIYEYFLGEFAKSEGQGAGEFYTPTSIVRLIVEVLEPYHGRILDPACGSGGMFVQSAEFVKDHLKNPHREISIYGQEKAEDTVRLCKMNLAVHGLSGDIKQGNTYYEDVFNMLGKFDFVLANPPFNVNNVDKEAIKEDPRYPFGAPSIDNANYLWIQIFYSMLNEKGRAGFVIANQAADAGYSEMEIRKKLVKNDAVDVIISVASNFFFTVTLPVTLWFLDKAKKDTNKDQILFIDAREIYNQIDRAQREFTSQQLEFVSNIVRLYRGLEISEGRCSSSLINELFPDRKYRDVKGLCKVVTTGEVENQGWSLNPNRYVGVVSRTPTANDSYNKMLESVRNELETARTRILEELGKVLYVEWFVRFHYPQHENSALVHTQHGSIPQGWTFSTLKRLFPNKNVVMTGPFGSNLHARDYRKSGVPLILVKHVKNGRIIEKDLPLVGEHKLSELDKYRLRVGDIVVTRVGFVGDSAYVRERHENWLFSGQMLRVRIPDSEVIHPLFLAFQFQTHEFRKKIENTAVGATRPSLNTKLIEEMEILVPPIELQKSFVSALSENGKLLQEMIDENGILAKLSNAFGSLVNHKKEAEN